MMRRFRSFDGTTIAFHDEGAGPAVVLLHGWGFDGLGNYGHFDLSRPLIETALSMWREALGPAPPMPDPPEQGRAGLIPRSFSGGRKHASPTRASDCRFTPTADEVLRAVREEMQADRADVMAKNLSLTAEQAAKFWPMYEAYQKQQNAVMDAQLKGIQQFVEGFDKLDDAGALGLMKPISIATRRWPLCG